MTAIEKIRKDIHPLDLARKGSKAAGTGAVAGACFGALLGALSGAVAGVATWTAVTVSREAWKRYQDRD